MLPLFGSEKKAADSLSTGKVQTLIGEGTEIKGNIQSNGVVRIDGFLDGTIQHSGELIIGPKGRLTATIKTKALAVAGEIHGEVEVEGRLELLAGARLYGDIRCGHLVVHEGATFHGQSYMAGEKSEQGTEPAR